MMCLLFIYSSLDLLEFLNLWTIVFHQFWKILFEHHSAPFSLLSSWNSSYIYAELYTLSSTLLNLPYFLLLNLCVTCWIISSDPLCFKIFSYNVVISQNSLMFCLELAVSLFIVFPFLADICKLVFYSLHIISITPL